MWIERIAIYSILGYILGQIGYDWQSAIFWCVLGLVICLQAIARSEGYDDATEAAEAVWADAKRKLEAAMAREQRILDLIKEHKDTQ